MQEKINYFQNVPMEILVNVLRYLGPEHLKKMGQVDRHMSNVVWEFFVKPLLLTKEPMAFRVFPERMDYATRASLPKVNDYETYAKMSKKQQKFFKNIKPMMDANQSGKAAKKSLARVLKGLKKIKSISLLDLSSIVHLLGDKDFLSLPKEIKSIVMAYPVYISVDAVINFIKARPGLESLKILAGSGQNINEYKMRRILYATYDLPVEVTLAAACETVKPFVDDINAKVKKAREEQCEDSFITENKSHYAHLQGYERTLQDNYYGNNNAVAHRMASVEKPLSKTDLTEEEKKLYKNLSDGFQAMVQTQNTNPGPSL